MTNTTDILLHELHTSERDKRLINQIVDRVWRDCAQKLYNTKTELQMDITAVHCNGCPLDLERMASPDVPEFDLAHDIMGIADNLNRDTGQLDNCFLPRFYVGEDQND